MHKVVIVSGQVGQVVIDRACLLIKLAWIQSRLAANVWPAIIWSLQGMAMGNHFWKKIPQENYNGEIVSTVITDARNRVWHFKKNAYMVTCKFQVCILFNFRVIIVLWQTVKQTDILSSLIESGLTFQRKPKNWLTLINTNFAHLYLFQ